MATFNSFKVFGAEATRILLNCGFGKRKRQLPEQDPVNIMVWSTNHSDDDERWSAAAWELVNNSRPMIGGSGVVNVHDRTITTPGKMQFTIHDGACVVKMLEENWLLWDEMIIQLYQFNCSTCCTLRVHDEDPSEYISAATLLRIHLSGFHVMPDSPPSG